MFVDIPKDYLSYGKQGIDSFLSYLEKSYAQLIWIYDSDQKMFIGFE